MWVLTAVERTWRGFKWNVSLIFYDYASGNKDTKYQKHILLVGSVLVTYFISDLYCCLFVFYLIILV